MRKFWPFLFLFVSCVDVQLQKDAVTQMPVMDFFKLDCLAFKEEGIHFSVSACDRQTAKKILDASERFYDALMSDTGLYSFVPESPYPVIVYSNRQSYLLKTKSPEYSAAVTKGRTIALYNQSDYQGILAHEITHLIINEFMENYSDSFIYINEGLAVYQERKADTSANLRYSDMINREVRKNPMSFLEMISYRPPKQAKPSVYISKWYAQVGSVVEYMIKMEGSFRFSIFLKNIKRGYDVDSALKDAYSGTFQDYKDLERKWRAWL